METIKKLIGPARLHGEKNLKSEEILLENYLENEVRTLKNHSEYFREIRNTGGRIEFFIGLYINKNTGSTLPSSLVNSISQLGIDLAFDIYPE